MGRRKNRGQTPPVDAAPPVVAVPPVEPVETPAAPEAPIGILWTWTPDSEPAPTFTPPKLVEPADQRPVAPASSFADQVADIVSATEVAPVVKPSTDGPPVGVLWGWTPDTATTPAPAPAAPPPPVEPVETPPAPPVVEVQDDVLPRNPPAPVAPIYQAPPPAEELTTLRPTFTLDPTKVLPAPALLAPPLDGDVLDDQLWLDVPKVRIGASRGVRAAVLGVVLALCAALPWVVPQIADSFGDAVPETVLVDPARTPDPTFAPLTPESSATPVESLEGVRLEAAGEPLEVTVKRLQVQSEVVPISGESGELIPPDNPQILGWWQEGAQAGAANGSVVVTGHTVSTGGGAFDHLGKLEPGDKIRVRTAAGSITYVVREVRDVPVEELARTSAAIFDQQIDGRLVLITCSDFDGQVYRSNSVVYASPIKDSPRR